ncbi:MAG: universal stress protein [Bacteroidota bacterium]
MKTILIPTDFSDDARNAMMYSLPLAKEWGAEILLLHVYPPPTGPDVAWVYVESEREQWESGAREQMKKLQALIKERVPEVNVRYEIRQGPLVNEVLTLAEEANADMILMGTEGAKGLEKLLVGTRTAGVVSYAKCPVWVVPEDYKDFTIERIVFASDYQEEDLEVLKELAWLAERFEAKIVILHIAPEILSYEEQKFGWYKELIEEGLAYKNIEFELIKHYDVQEGLRDYIRFNKINLLSMTMKKRNMLERLLKRSDTKEMSYQTEIPLLAFHERDFEAVK